MNKADKKKVNSYYYNFIKTIENNIKSYVSGNYNGPIIMQWKVYRELNNDCFLLELGFYGKILILTSDQKAYSLYNQSDHIKPIHIIPQDTKIQNAIDKFIQECAASDKKINTQFDSKGQLSEYFKGFLSNTKYAGYYHEFYDTITTINLCSNFAKTVMEAIEDITDNNSIVMGLYSGIVELKHHKKSWLIIFDNMIKHEKHVSKIGKNVNLISLESLTPDEKEYIHGYIANKGKIFIKFSNKAKLRQYIKNFDDEYRKHNQGACIESTSTIESRGNNTIYNVLGASSIGSVLLAPMLNIITSNKSISTTESRWNNTDLFTPQQNTTVYLTNGNNNTAIIMAVLSAIVMAGSVFFACCKIRSRRKNPDMIENGKVKQQSTSSVDEESGRLSSIANDEEQLTLSGSEVSERLSIESEQQSDLEEVRVESGQNHTVRQARCCLQVVLKK